MLNIAEMNQRVFQIEADIDDVDHEIRSCHESILELRGIRKEANYDCNTDALRRAERLVEDFEGSLRRLSELRDQLLIMKGRFLEHISAIDETEHCELWKQMMKLGPGRDT